VWTFPQRFREVFCKAQEGSKPIEYAYTMLTLYMYFACSYIYEETSHGLYRPPALVADPSCVRLRETERKLTGAGSLLVTTGRRPGLRHVPKNVQNLDATALHGPYTSENNARCEVNL
jgi:hypothetical protein